MKIKKKKMFKSKHLFFAQFSSKTGDFFCIDGKIPKFCHKYFFKWQMWFFWWFWPKNWNCWSDNLQTFHKEKSGVDEKNLENENFIPTAVHCENWYFKKTNICHYFPSMDLPPNIWSIQLVPFYNPCIWSLFNALFMINAASVHSQVVPNIQ